jgi:hypothetical protein
MTKLLKFKPWLRLDEAASRRHLPGVQLCGDRADGRDASSAKLTDGGR